jgi:hypothetical protein
MGSVEIRFSFIPEIIETHAFRAALDQLLIQRQSEYPDPINFLSRFRGITDLTLFQWFPMPFLLLLAFLLERALADPATPIPTVTPPSAMPWATALVAGLRCASTVGYLGGAAVLTLILGAIAICVMCKGSSKKQSHNAAPIGTIDASHVDDLLVRVSELLQSLSAQVEKTDGLVARVAALEDRASRRQTEQEAALGGMTARFEEAIQKQTAQLRELKDQSAATVKQLTAKADPVRSSPARTVPEKPVPKPSPSPTPTPGRVVHESRFDKSRPMDGLIRYLAFEPKCSSSCDAERWGPDKLADGNEDTYYHSDDGNNQWVGIDFKNMRVQVTHYTLLARRNKGPDDRNPRSWTLEGSTAGFGGPWTELDARKDQRELNGRGNRATFPVTSALPWRVIRVRATGAPYGHSGLVLAGLELFGTLIITS